MRRLPFRGYHSRLAHFGLILGSLLTLTSNTDAIPPAIEKWIRVQTENFTILSNASPKDVRRCVRELERFGVIVEGDQAVKGARALLPTTIILFKNDATFAPYKRSADGTPMNLLGLFTAGRDANYISLSLEGGRASLQTVYHEYVHYLLNKRSLEVPLWLNEGMAEFYSTFRMDEDQIEIGLPVEDHVRFLRVLPMIPFVDLFAMTTDSPDYNEGIRQGIFYAESWALYHYLLKGRPELRPRLAVFMDNLSKGIPTHQAFVSAFGTDYEPLERELRAYIAAGNFNVQRIQIETRESDEGAKVDPASRVDVLYTLAEYLVHATPWQSHDIESHLQEAIAVDPQHARSHAAIARLLEARGRRVDADEEFRNAARLAPHDDWIYLQFGIHRLNRALARDPDPLVRPDSLPADAQRARALFRQAIDLNPNHVESRVLYGLTYILDPGPYGPGIAELRAALATEPSRMDAALWLVILLLRNDDRESAAALAEQVQAQSRDPEIRSLAQRVLGVDAGRRTTRDQIVTGAERERTRVARDEMSRTEVELELDAAEKRQVQSERYNDAVRRVKAGEVSEAIAILEPLVGSAQDPELASRARELLAQLRVFQQHQQEKKLFDQAIATARSGDLKAAIAALERLGKQTRDPNFRAQVEKALIQLRAVADRAP